MDDAALKQFLEGKVPATDPDFVISVMARIERKQFRGAMLRTGGVAAGIALLLALAAPSLNNVLNALAAPMANEWMIGGLLTAGILTALFWPVRD